MAGRDEFPFSSEDDEMVNIAGKQEAIYRDSRDNLGDEEEANNDEEEKKHDEGEEKQINMVSKNVKIDDDKEYWLGHTGASCHVTNDETKITKLSNSTSDRVIVGDQQKCKVVKKGELLTATMDGSSLLLKTVRVVNKIGKNIISIGVLLEDGGKMYAEGREMIVEYKGATLVFYKNAKDGLII